MHGCVFLPFLGFSKSWFASHVWEKHSYSQRYILKSSEKLGSWTPGLSLQCRRECEDASSHTPQRHFVSSSGKTVMGTCTVRHKDEEKKYTKSSLVSVLTELLWVACCRSYMNRRKMVKRTLWLLSPAGGWRPCVPRPPRWFGKFYCWSLQP